MKTGIAAALGAIGGAGAGFVAGHALTMFAAGRPKTASAKEARDEIVGLGMALGTVIGGLLSASVAAHPETPST